MRTLLTIEQQHEWLANNGATIEHRWSLRGMGNSKILNGQKDIIGKAGGCGYDRYGAALGNTISALFPDEALKLAKRECKDRKNYANGSEKFYGLFYRSKDKTAYLDGGCGSRCMIKVLNKIGFSLKYVGETNSGQSGSTFYTLIPVTKHERKWL